MTYYFVQRVKYIQAVAYNGVRMIYINAQPEIEILNSVVHTSSQKLRSVSSHVM